MFFARIRKAGVTVNGEMWENRRNNGRDAVFSVGRALFDDNYSGGSYVMIWAGFTVVCGGKS